MSRYDGMAALCTLTEQLKYDLQFYCGYPADIASRGIPFTAYESDMHGEIYLRYSNTMGISCASSSNVLIQNCEVAFVGGGSHIIGCADARGAMSLCPARASGWSGDERYDFTWKSGDYDGDTYTPNPNVHVLGGAEIGIAYSDAKLSDICAELLNDSEAKLFSVE